MFRLWALLIGYAIGCIQVAYIVGRINGVDIREHGSKNAGMTNITRVIGKKAGATVFLIDVFKGMLVFAIATWIWGSNWIFPDYLDYANYALGILPGIYAGIGAVLGHCFPFYLKFRGGKGVASTLGLIIMLDLHVMAIAFSLALIAVIATRFISLASLVGTLTVVVVMAIFGFGLEEILLMGGLTALIWVLHRENIVRLLSGTERKFLQKTPTE